MFRRATDSDYPAIEALSEAIWGDDTEAAAKRPPGWNRRRWTVGAHMSSDEVPTPTTLVAEVDGRVVAAGSIHLRRHAPHNDIYLHVAPGFRDQGIGAALYEALDSTNDAGPYMTRELGDPEMVALFESLGFQAVERVTEGWIHPTEPATVAWIDEVLAAPRHDLSIVPLGAAGSPAPVEVARLYDRDFQRAHAHLPVTPRSDADALDFFLGAASFSSPPKTTSCAVSGERLVGAGTLSPPVFGEDDPGSAHLVWVSATPPDPAETAVVVEVLVAHLLNAARQQGLRVQVEAGTIYPHVKACIDSIPGTDLEQGLTILITDPPTGGGGVFGT